MRTAIIAVAVLAAGTAWAGWAGLPLASNTNVLTIDAAEFQYNVSSQLLAACNERCLMAGIAPLSIVQTWRVTTGEGQSVVTNGGYVYTNVVLVTTNVTFTNVVGQFTVGSVTGRTFATAFFWARLLDKVRDLYERETFIVASYAPGSFWTAWFEQTQTNGLYVTDFPVESMAGAFDRAGIGFTTNVTYSAQVTNFVTGGGAYWTRRPPREGDWLIAEIHAQTNRTWKFANRSLFDICYFNDTVPVLRYSAGGTNPLTPLTITIQGSHLVDVPPVYDPSSQSQTGSKTQEVVAVTSGTTTLGYVWSSITNMVIAGDADNAGDVLAVVYTNSVGMYRSGVPGYDEVTQLWMPDATMIDECYVALKGLYWTGGISGWKTDYGGSNNFSYAGVGADCAEAVADYYAASPSQPEYSWNWKSSSWSVLGSDTAGGYAVYGQPYTLARSNDLGRQVSFYFQPVAPLGVTTGEISPGVINEFYPGVYPFGASGQYYGAEYMAETTNTDVYGSVFGTGDRPALASCGTTNLIYKGWKINAAKVAVEWTGREY